jgi:hypothetical protein
MERCIFFIVLRTSGDGYSLGRKKIASTGAHLLWQEREGHLVKVYWKKEMVDRSIIRIIHNKIYEVNVPLSQG